MVNTTIFDSIYIDVISYIIADKPHYAVSKAIIIPRMYMYM